jgi:hypothetical protein
MFTIGFFVRKKQHWRFVRFQEEYKRFSISTLEMAPTFEHIHFLRQTTTSTSSSEYRDRVAECFIALNSQLYSALRQESQVALAEDILVRICFSSADIMADRPGSSTPLLYYQT